MVSCQKCNLENISGRGFDLNKYEHTCNEKIIMFSKYFCSPVNFKIIRNRLQMVLICYCLAALGTIIKMLSPYIM